MRQTFFKELEKLAVKDRNIFLLTANLGFKLFDSFREHCPNQFLDVGVAEQNMIGIASGLALSGKNVYCYSIIPFLLMRAYEQIRANIAYHNLSIKLIGAGGGFAYGLEGFSHFGIEDLSLMRSMPNMSIVVPADSQEAGQFAKLSRSYPHPLYIRLGQNGDPAIHAKIPNVKIGKGIILNEGKNVAIFVTGNIVFQVKEAMKLLVNDGISCTLIDMHTLSPLDTNLILKRMNRQHAIFTVEEHSITGGLGSAVAEVLAENHYKGIFERIGIPEKLKKVIGDKEYLRQKHGLSSKEIYCRIKKSLRKTKQ